MSFAIGEILSCKNTSRICREKGERCCWWWTLSQIHREKIMAVLWEREGWGTLCPSSARREARWLVGVGCWCRFVAGGAGLASLLICLRPWMTPQFEWDSLHDPELRRVFPFYFEWETVLLVLNNTNHILISFDSDPDSPSHAVSTFTVRCQ